ncbi:hypothetical protein E2C01_040655 [Portunus trituberculatus]|uniref:Uncharacterized protein n=2 Tax=Portunus trituberculatus TaxID=210409 RepID=A0A5B7FRD0_PORTR|nr:hypothetical protein [Portunus trituberculatus]
MELSVTDKRSSTMISFLGQAGIEITVTRSSGRSDGVLSIVLYSVNSNMFGLAVTLLKTPSGS